MIASLFLPPGVSAAAEERENCRSNSINITWQRVLDHSIHSSEQPVFSKQVLRERTIQAKKAGEDKVLCESQSLDDAKKDAWEFLRNHVMDCDKPKMQTLGFGTPSSAYATYQPDGLGDGMIGPTIELALQAKMDFPWTDQLPKNIFYEYVLNYANFNEARSNWRPLLWEMLNPLVRAKMNSTNAQLQPNDVVRLVNQKLWNAFPSHESIYFHSGQTPLIFDPMSVIVFGYASCTGLAILLVSALRTVGIPARVVGTPAWNANPDKGNHNWVEVYHPNMASGGGDDWIFFEPSANQTKVEDLVTKPCSKWFCEPGRFPVDNINNTLTQVYAARLVFDNDNIISSKTISDEGGRGLIYPMPWEWDSRDVPGENRTDYYQRVCSRC